MPRNLTCLEDSRKTSRAHYLEPGNTTHKLAMTRLRFIQTRHPPGGCFTPKRIDSYRTGASRLRSGLLEPLSALLAVLLAMMVTTPSVHAEQPVKPSFDCDKAQTQDEHAICSDNRLAELDQAVSIAYSQAEVKFKDEARAAARDALAARNSCGGDRMCILDQQVNAITILFSNLGAQVPVPPWVGAYRIDLFKGRSEPPAKALPDRIAQCTITKIASISGRLAPNPGTDGTQVSFANGGLLVSYAYEPDIANSHIGDEVLLCLVSTPKNCPPGDDRGKFYSGTNLRTTGSWLLPDAEHMCGGA
jgi:uncharacterized protein